MDDGVLLLLRAIDFAAAYHQGQRRKGADAAPYINHPLRVAHLLAEIGQVRDVELLAAAVLHDTVEDTRATLVDLEALFGRKVRTWVEEVSDDKSLPKEERKRLQVEHAPHLSAGAALIKLADKIDNVREIIDNPPVGWSAAQKLEYIDWAKSVVRALPPGGENLASFFWRLVGESARE